MEQFRPLHIFVASRMKNIVERKSAIDVVHSLGHVPVFIEAEQMARGIESKALMESMVERSDAFLMICDDHLGHADSNLEGRPPLIFELQHFMARDQVNGAPPGDSLHIWMREPFGVKGEPIVPELNAQIAIALPGLSEIKYHYYREYHDLAADLYSVVLGGWGRGNLSRALAGMRLHLRFGGADSPGILGRVAELLYSKFRLNVSYVSGSSVGGLAALDLTAECWEPERKLPDEDSVMEAINRELSSLGVERLPDAEATSETLVRTLPAATKRSTFYFELGVLDVPGVLSALCKALAQQEINIRALQQRPAREEGRSEIILRAAPAVGDEIAESEIYRRFLRLETRLRNLVGVQSLSSMIARS
ncbi:hypothetical protein ABI59_10935 [Acidobacteria bacterium Mor1]|nr:hypothetical protein ABI59_10935 [Acidobacteria bacterium Mor1]